MEQCCTPRECRTTDERYVDRDQHELGQSVRNIKSPDLREECKWCSWRRSASEPLLWSCKCGDASLCISVILVQCYAYLDSLGTLRHCFPYSVEFSSMHCFAFHFFLLTLISASPQSTVIHYTVWTCLLELLLVQRLL
jgi:hypothetical protein